MLIPPNRGAADVDIAALKSAKPSSTKPVAGASGSTADKVTLSAAARERSAPPAAAASAAPLSRAAHTNAADADRLARDFAYTEDRPLLDATDFLAGKGPLKYAATGESVTADSEASFEKHAAQALKGRIALYESEKAKGTPGADIYDKIVSYMNAQSADFLQHTGWKNLSDGSARST